MSHTITKAVIPVAGLGTRFLPATKAIPKEMITLVDRPLIQYVVEEAAAAGITEVILVTHSSKSAIENHFDANIELEMALQAKGKTQLLSLATGTCPPGVNVIAVRQPQALGLGHAVLCAAPVIGDEYFAVILPDVLMKSTGTSAENESVDLSDMMAAFERTGKAQIMVEQVSEALVSNYGIVDLMDRLNIPGQSADIRAIVEKPDRDKAPSCMAVTGRYVLPVRIMSLLKTTEVCATGEIQLTTAIDTLMSEVGVQAYLAKQRSYDCGSKLGYLQATVDFALSHAQLSSDFSAWLKERQSVRD